MLVGATLLGAVIGSFLNVVVYRLPRGEFFAKGKRSVCPACGARIAWHDNVPVLGWLLLRGRARCCGARISPRYPIVEALTAALFAALWLYPPSGLALAATDLEAAAVLAFALHGFFVANLVANSFIDIDHRILPDELTKSGMVVGCVGALLVPGLGGETFAIHGVSPALRSLLWAAAGLLAGAGATWAVRALAGPVFRQEAMGLGDVKLMGAIGAFVGWQGALLTFFLGCLLGAGFGVLHRFLTGEAGKGAAHRWQTGDREIWFGPFLAVGAVIALFARHELLALLTAFQEWQRTSPTAPMVLLPAAVLSLISLVFLVRRGRAR